MLPRGEGMVAHEGLTSLPDGSCAKKYPQKKLDWQCPGAITHAAVSGASCLQLGLR